MRMSLYKLVHSLKIIQINVNYEEGNVNGRKIWTAITANNITVKLQRGTAASVV